MYHRTPPSCIDRISSWRGCALPLPKSDSRLSHILSLSCTPFMKETSAKNVFSSCCKVLPGTRLLSSPDHLSRDLYYRYRCIAKHAGSLLRARRCFWCSPKNIWCLQLDVNMAKDAQLLSIKSQKLHSVPFVTLDRLQIHMKLPGSIVLFRQM